LLVPILRPPSPPRDPLLTLTPHLNDTVMAMSDQIIPATDPPGAKGARVNEFIDVILSEWATPEERTHFLEGLAGIDKESQQLFGKNFAEASPQQQLTQLRAIDDATLAGRTTRVRHGNTIPEPDAQLKGDLRAVCKRIPPEKDYVEHVPVWELKYRYWDNRAQRAANQPVQRECYYACDEYSNKFFVNDSENPYTSDPGKHFAWIRGRQVGGKSITW